MTVAATVLPCGDDSFKAAILQRMVFDFDPPVVFVRRIETWPFGHGPAFQHTADLQPKIVVQVRRVVLLDDEFCRRAANWLCRSARLGRLFEISLLPRYFTKLIVGPSCSGKSNLGQRTGPRHWYPQDGQSPCQRAASAPPAILAVLAVALVLQ